MHTKDKLTVQSIYLSTVIAFKFISRRAYRSCTYLGRRHFNDVCRTCCGRDRNSKTQNKTSSEKIVTVFSHGNNNGTLGEIESRRGNENVILTDNNNESTNELRKLNG